MTPVQLVAIFAGVPLAVFLLITLVASVPSRRRYRPGVPWEADPVWFNGPDDTPAGADIPGPVGGAGGSW